MFSPEIHKCSASHSVYTLSLTRVRSRLRTHPCLNASIRTTRCRRHCRSNCCLRKAVQMTTRQVKGAFQKGSREERKAKLIARYECRRRRNRRIYNFVVTADSYVRRDGRTHPESENNTRYAGTCLTNIANKPSHMLLFLTHLTVLDLAKSLYIHRL